MIFGHRAVFPLFLWVAACPGRNNDAQPTAADHGEASQAAEDAAGKTPAGAAAPYQLAAVDDKGRLIESGSLEVTVEWPNPEAELLRSPGPSDCGELEGPPVSVHVLHGVREVVVWLAGVALGRAPAPAATVELAVRGCRFHPQVAVAPCLGARLAVESDDERRHEVVLEFLGSDGPELIARIPMPLIGQRFEIPLDSPGVVRARRVGGASTCAYVHVPAHPYMALTDEQGKVTFAEVVPGTYNVVAWHRPLSAAGDPVTVSAEVVVVAGEQGQLTMSMEGEGGAR